MELSFLARRSWPKIMGVHITLNWPYPRTILFMVYGRIIHSMTDQKMQLLIPKASTFYRVSLDSGRNFTTRNTIGKDIGDSADFVQVTTAFSDSYSGKSNDGYVVWSDVLKYRQPFNFELFYQTIANNGTTLSEPINLSNNDGNSIGPKIAVSERDNVYVIWKDDTSGNGDIFFIRAY